jgi:hypothetical protein
MMPATPAVTVVVTADVSEARRNLAYVIHDLDLLIALRNYDRAQMRIAVMEARCR